jgi:heterodisulfide reductase subunit C
LIHFVQQITFILVISATAFILYNRIVFIRKAIKLGRQDNLNDQSGKRWKRVFLLAFGQKKMFKRIVPAIFHLILYLGFIIINIEVLEFIIDGITGNHRVFARALNPGEGYSVVYTVIMNIFEWLALGVIIACIIFLVRRNVLKINRFRGIEMRSWPVLDANLILIFEIFLMLAILTMNAADQLLQVHNVAGYPATGNLLLSRVLILPLLEGAGVQSLIFLERTAWWFHILGILGFAIYVTYSKHLHIILAFPNTYYASLRSPASISNMEVVTQEVRMMLGIQAGEPDSPAVEAMEHLGASDIHDLTWKNLMDAFTCTECGRCTAVCPANITGKKLSPRKIMMDTRDRAEAMARNSLENNSPDETGSLFDLISREEIFACTTCSACIEACPVSIDPLSIIIQMRRYTTMEESTAPAAWNMMFGNIENNFAPWKFPSADRFKWAEELQK